MQTFRQNLRNNHTQSGNSPLGLLANTATENSNQVSSSTSAITKQEPSGIYLAGARHVDALGGHSDRFTCSWKLTWSWAILCWNLYTALVSIVSIVLIVWQRVIYSISIVLSMWHRGWLVSIVLSMWHTGLWMALCDQVIMVAICVSLVGLSDYTVTTNSDTMVNLV